MTKNEIKLASQAVYYYCIIKNEGFVRDHFEENILDVLEECNVEFDDLDIDLIFSYGEENLF